MEQLAYVQYTCLEPGCDTVVVGDDDNDLVERVNEHMAREHEGFELPEVIWASSEPAHSGAEPERWGGHDVA